MTYMKFTPYIYLIFGIYFIYDGITKWNATETTPWLSFIVAGLAIFMFFFRLGFAKKFQDRNKKS
jgi:uncharacterized membrane protein